MSAEALIELIDLFRGERRYNKKLTDAALNAISEAIVATRSYEGRARIPKTKALDPIKRDRDEEVRIGGLWQAAAIKTRNVSAEFANRLNDKALYWFLEFHWSAEEVVSRKIDWTSIDNEVRTLLGKSS